MRKQLLLLVLSAVVFSTGTLVAGGWDSVRHMMGISEQKGNPTIKVLVEDRVPGAMLEVTGSYNIYDPATGEKIASRFADKRYFIQPTASGVKWGEQFPGIYQIAIVPDEMEHTTVLVGGVQYKGAVLVYQIDDKLSFVNELPVEDYVKSAVSSALKPGETVQDEALAAMVIVARTNAYYQKLRDLDAYWHVQAREENYQGLGVLRADVSSMTDYTRGLVMKQEANGMTEGTFAAVWTEHSAGHTAPYHIMFRRHALAPGKGVDAPFAIQTREETKWEMNLTRAQLASKLGTGEIQEVEAFRDEGSEKVYGLRVIHSGGVSNFDFISLQNKLGKGALQSSQFTVEEEGEKVHFTGYGRGHGVGMCLYSAKVMADYGKEAPEILEEFFPHVKLSLIDHTGLEHGGIR